MSRIGDALARPDGRGKVTGQARYAADQKTAHLLYGIYGQATIPAGRVTTIDVAPALTQPGVIRVLTAVDMPRIVLEHSPPAASLFMPMQTDEVRHQGQPVAIVLAETLEAAEEGARLARPSYERKAFLAPDQDSSRAPPRAIPPKSDSGYATLAALEHRVGNAEANLAAAVHRVDAIYVQPSRHNNPMEPSATLAVWQGDQLTLYDAVQHVYSVQTVVAEALKLKPEQVRVICPHTGGGFGAKGYVWPHQILTATAAKIVGRPVKIVLSRADMYANVGYQPRIVHTIALGAMMRAGSLR